MTAAGAGLAGIGVVCALFAAWRFVFFHRNPQRTIPPGDDPLCPADGSVLYREDVALGPDAATAYLRRVTEAFGAAGKFHVVATYLSLFDVHVVRAPVAGRVRLCPLAPVGENRSMGASFFAAALRRPLPVEQRGYADKNELCGIEIAGDLPVLVVLMADWWIDQIIVDVADGDEVTRGQVVGRIRMGSQVDLFAPAGALDIRLPIGDQVRAGLTVLGRRRGAGPLPAGRAMSDRGDKVGA